MSEYKKIKLAVELDASDFPDEVENECANHEINTHYQNDSFSLDWNQPYLLLMKKWLLETYGPDIKNYNTFAVLAT